MGALGSLHGNDHGKTQRRPGRRGRDGLVHLLPRRREGRPRLLRADIHDLARGATFEEVCYLLWHRRLPTRAELGDLQSQLAAARPIPEPIVRLMRSLPAVDGMDALRTITSALAHYDAEANDASPAAQYRKAVRLTAQIGTVVAAWGRLTGGGARSLPIRCSAMPPTFSTCSRASVRTLATRRSTLR